MLAREVLAGLGLVDHHCHPVTGADLDRPAFEALLTEAPDPAAAGGSTFDTPLGVAVRRWCAPALDLAAHAPPGEYLARRSALGPVEANRRLLRAAGSADLLVDGGYQPAEPVPPGALAAASGARVYRVVRLESVAEEVAAGGVTAAGFAEAFADLLGERAAGAVAVKSIAAYRTGLDLDPRRPRPAEVAAAVGGWLAATERSAAERTAPERAAGPAGPGRYRLADPVLTRHLLWTAVVLGLPIQLHTGFGDPDLRLHRSDPALLADFCAATATARVPLLLLHCYPYHRQAGYLASAYPHVYLDLGLTLNHVGARAPAVLAETLELAPFGKLLYSSDAYGLAELYLLGASQFRRALGSLLDGWVAAGDLAAADAGRYAAMIGADTARRIYRLPPTARLDAGAAGPAPGRGGRPG